MSRHRDVRSLNYSDECDGYDDVYGHSVEDDYSISPSVEQFMFDRSRQSEMSAFIKDKDGIAEEDEDAEEGHEQSLSPQTRPRLNELDEARLQSCLDEIRNVIGESTPERLLIDTIVKNGFDLHRSLDAVLNSTAGKASKTAAAEPREKDSVSKSNQNLVCGLPGLPPPPPFDLSSSAPSSIDLSAALVPPMTNLALTNSQMALLPPPPPMDFTLAVGDIDLSSALVGPPLPTLLDLPPPPSFGPAKENHVPVKIKARKAAHCYDLELDLVKQKADSLLGLGSNLLTRRSSNLGTIICRKWLRKFIPAYLDPYPVKSSIPRFGFNSPSPDDKVLRSLNKKF